KQHLADGHEIALPLEHASELGEVGLQPVLFGVLIRRRAQVLDHSVDVVFELRHLAARVDLNRTGEVTLGDGGGDIRDSAYLRHQIGGQKIDVVGQIFPRTGDSRNQ